MTRFLPIDELPDDAPDWIKAAQTQVAAATVDYLPTADMLAPYLHALTDAYILYCQSVSKRSMAISLETAAYLAYLADHLKPAASCDLGSGFTSLARTCPRPGLSRWTGRRASARSGRPSRMPCLVTESW